ncbi:hypothetical protein [Maricaulis sp.]|uniref:hypothetical protein n=1 Tax=Maricaulis sp. TaxID=1486257 RepID=UPI00263249F6|nr:hypothetical protein [Maricaulis sp.]
MSRDHTGETYGYDQYNRLTDVGGSSNIALAYDPAGRLQATSGTGVTFREFLHDGLDLIAEYDGNGTMQARYVHGSGMDEPPVQYTGAGTRAWLIADERGSIVAHVNDSGGGWCIRLAPATPCALTFGLSRKKSPA